jgi:hypothetical protein
MVINEGDDSSPQPFTNLLPIVDALASGGNPPLDGGFVLDPDGWRCRMTRPIDFELIAARFTLPPSIVASRATDTVLDRSTWISIEGPGAEGHR